MADEYELERGLSTSEAELAELLNRDHVGPSEERRKSLLSLATRDRKLVKELYQLYSGRCQLCAFDSVVVYGTPSAEAHHIVYLSRGGDDTLDNMVLLCPNHHTVIHNTDATFDYGSLRFCFPNGRIEPLCMNTHLCAHQPLVVSVSVIEDHGRSPLGEKLSELIRIIQEELSPDLLTAEYAASIRPGDHPLKGYCYVASEALYHLAGGPSSGLIVFRCSLPEGGTHWWLSSPSEGLIDPTSAQFPKPPPYSQGIRTSFLSTKPSKRTNTLISRVRSRVDNSAPR